MNGRILATPFGDKAQPKVGEPCTRTGKDMARTHSSPVTRVGPILLVDDYDDARALVREALENHGYRVVEAANGQQALDFLVSRREERVPLIILDLQMPIMDGWQLLELMRCYVGLSAIPVIVVTALEARREQMRHTGIVACIHAPYAMDDLIAAVDDCLLGHRSPNSSVAGESGR
jgi:CheY-like chemotaxis protein